MYAFLSNNIFIPKLSNLNGQLLITLIAKHIHDFYKSNVCEQYT